MEDRIICLDTSILIDFFRKTKKENSIFFEITKKYDLFAVSTVTAYEIFGGSNPEQDIFWNAFFENIKILPFDSNTCKVAIKYF